MGKRRACGSGMRVAAGALALLLSSAALVACSTSGAPPTSGSSGATPGQPGASTSAPTTSVGQSPNPAVEVNWGDGRNAPGMKDGLPNPQGWYDRAFGGPTTEKIIYVTFDDGPREPYTSQLLALLRQANAKATFFVIGQQAKQYPGLITAEVRAGHAIGDHTWDHPDLIGQSDARVREELTSVQRQVGAGLGPCMRPPYGLVDEQVANISLSLSLTPILWTAHAQEWDNPPVQQMVAALQRGTKPGAVFLLHDGGGSRDHTVAAVRQLLPWWQAQGYRLETVPACRVGG